MKYESVVWFNGKPYRSYKSDRVASLADRWNMMRITWRIMRPPKEEGATYSSNVRFLKTRVMWILFKYVANPVSHAYYYKEIEA